eukprot:m.1581455 g.1581455  ORF g.1581455 m.1581455 type:complete len:176 (-) comp25317_c0_seq6:2232-2759(-)
MGAYSHAPPGSAPDYMWVPNGSASMPMHTSMHPSLAYPMPYGHTSGMPYASGMPPPPPAGAGGYPVPQYVRSPYEEGAGMYEPYARSVPPHEGWQAPPPYGHVPYPPYYDAMHRGGGTWPGHHAMPPHTGYSGSTVATKGMRMVACQRHRHFRLLGTCMRAPLRCVCVSTVCTVR